MINQLAQARILVVGDVMLDQYYTGTTHRVSPEAPVPVVGVDNIHTRIGGAGNVALNIASLEGQVAICGFVGQDDAAKQMQQQLSSNNIMPYLIETAQPTIRKLRVLAQRQQLLRMDFEQPFHQEYQTSLYQQVAQLIDDYDVLVLSDYGKGTLSNPQALIELANAHQCPVLVDPKQMDFSAYAKASYITPNQKEFQQAAGAWTQEADLIAKAREQIQRHQLKGLLITRSQDGMTLVDHQGQVQTVPTVAKEVFDVTGAGDTVIAVFAMAIATKWDMNAALRLANAAAGVVVGKVGTAVVTVKELQQAVYDQSHLDKGALSVSQLSQAIEESHLRGETIVMTNGCFDLLHAGHVDYLKKARALGDRLIVAVNTDSSIQRLKGAHRPVMPLEKRLEVLSALACVDWVVAFDQDTPAELIAQLQPDVLVKGADYQVNEIAGADTVLSRGGRVETIDLVPGVSTSEIIQRIIQQHQKQ